MHEKELTCGRIHHWVAKIARDLFSECQRSTNEIQMHFVGSVHRYSFERAVDVIQLLGYSGWKTTIIRET